RTVGLLDHANVADLAAAFAVKRRELDGELAFVALTQCGNELAAARKAADARLGGFDERTGETHSALARSSNEQREIASAAACGLCAATAFALLFERSLETVAIDGHAARAQDVVGHVDRESVGVVEPERDVAGKA